MKDRRREPEKGFLLHYWERDKRRNKVADYKIKAMDDELLAEGFTCNRCSRSAGWIYIKKGDNKKEYKAFDKLDKHIRCWKSTEMLCTVHALEVQV